jgi:RNA polymerase sigma factor (sigma-70 family)
MSTALAAFSTHRPLLHRIVSAQLGSTGRADVDDVLSEVACRLAARAPRAPVFPSEPDAVAYCVAAVRNACRTWYRKRAARAVGEAAWAREQPGCTRDAAERVGLRDAIQWAWAQLTPKEQHVLRLVSAGEMSRETSAERMRVQRARQRFATYLHHAM